MGHRSRNLETERAQNDLRRPVRIDVLQKILGTEREDLAMRFGLLLQEYDNREIVPIRRRLLFLEKPWPIRVVISFWRRTVWLAQNAWILVTWIWERFFPPKPILEDERCGCELNLPHRVGEEGCLYVMDGERKQEIPERS